MIYEPTERLGTYLRWCLEHFSTYDELRKTDPVAAEQELKYLEDSIEKAWFYYKKLDDTIDPSPFI